jgi:hypothetical protein
VRRYHGDGLDRLTWEALGRPPTYRYHFEPTTDGGTPTSPEGRFTAWLAPMSFDARPTAELPLRIEAESLWPAREQRAAWGWPVRRAAAGASSDGWLRVLGAGETGRAAASAEGLVRLALPTRPLGGRPLRIRARLADTGSATLPLAGATIAVWANGLRMLHSALPASGRGLESATAWAELEAPPLPVDLVRLELVVAATAQVDLDYVELGPQSAAIAGSGSAGPADRPPGAPPQD